MARAGIYKSEVLRARDKLRALGRYPSIDAIRTELGTGSKGTIHRYLKEIEEDEGGSSGAKVPISEALHDLVASLATRLQEEADARVSDAEAKHAVQLQQRAQAMTAMAQERDGFRAQLERAEVLLAQERAKNEQAEAVIRARAIEQAQQAQQITDLTDRIAAEERNRQSLEEKHQHARDALEHFRQAAKEQREQESRQHEQQTQYLQAEARRLNEALTAKLHEVKTAYQDSVRLTSELSATRAELHRAQEECRAIKPLQDGLAKLERTAGDAQRDLVESRAAAKLLGTLNSSLETKVAELGDRNLLLERELEVARSAAQVQEQLVGTILARLGQAEDRKNPNPEKRPQPKTSALSKRATG